MIIIVLYLYSVVAGRPYKAYVAHNKLGERVLIFEAALLLT